MLYLWQAIFLEEEMGKKLGSSKILFEKMSRWSP